MVDGRRRWRGVRQTCQRRCGWSGSGMGERGAEVGREVSVRAVSLVSLSGAEGDRGGLRHATERGNF